MNLKKLEVFTSKFVGTGPSSYEKRIYRAAVWQRLRNTALYDSSFPSSQTTNAVSRSVLSYVITQQYLSLDEGTDRLFRDVNRELSLYTVVTQNSADLMYFAADAWNHANSVSIAETRRLMLFREIVLIMRAVLNS